MSILSWLKTVTEGNHAADVMHAHPPVQFAAGEEQFHGLNMRDALDAHIRWVQRLENQISGSDREKIQVATVACDDRCALGEWIHGAARIQFGNLPEYANLKRDHAEFHLRVGEVLIDIQAGAVEDARNRMRDIRRESGNVQLALIRLYSKSQN